MASDMVVAPFPVQPQDLQAREPRHVSAKKIGPAFVVPAGPTHTWRLVLAKWADGRILQVACAAKLVQEFSGWCFKSYEFQKAVDAASSPLGDGTVLVARNVTLAPFHRSIFSVPGDPPYAVYALLKARDAILTIASLGGPWRIRLHHAGASPSDPRCLLLTEETSTVIGQDFSLEACEGRGYGGTLSLQQHFCQAAEHTPAKAPQVWRTLAEATPAQHTPVQATRVQCTARGTWKRESRGWVYVPAVKHCGPPVTDEPSRGGQTCVCWACQKYGLPSNTKLVFAIPQSGRGPAESQ